MALQEESPELREAIRSLMAKRGNRVLSIADVHERVNAQAGASNWSREEIASTVESMEREGQLVAVRGKRYSLIEFTPFVAGPLRTHRDGYGFVFRGRGVPDVYIERKAMKGAMHGDLVLVRLLKESRRPAARGDREEGEVARILRREHRHVVGRFHADPEFPYVRPYDMRIDTDIDVDPEETMSARNCEMVNVEIERYGDKNSNPSGRVVEVLGMLGEPGVDIEVVIRKYRIPHRMPEDVLAEADAIPADIAESERANRVDLRDRDIVTIDGETAKDFDDAVEVIRLPNGNYELGVHIADVAHYVREGTALDREAFERGTSVYFPGRAVPMLPERLSNGICSLNPQVERLAFSTAIEIDTKGRFVNRRIFKSIIRTKERMTYTNVFALLDHPTPELEARYAPLLDGFHRMFELFEILRKRREARGSIDFDLPEGEVFLTATGEIETILPSQRNVAHRIIEEFMLAANEVVAEHLFFAGQPAVYRVHQPPDAQKIADLKEILAEFKHKLRGDPENLRPGDLQRVLKEVEGTDEERFLTEFVLRSMKRAIYSEENSGHFALALQNYCHFTSPIRRYPDLVVHRRLAALMEKGAYFGEQLDREAARGPMIAGQSSEREKRAEDAEREVLEWKKVIFMRDKVGLNFAGRITGVVPFGVFVELEEYFVQGLVPVASIGGDFWSFLEREHRLRGESSGREFRLGDQVVVEVREVDEDRRQIEFRLVEAGGMPVANRRRWEGRDGR